MSSGLTDVLTLRAIQELADARTFAPGMAYFHGGVVGLLDADEFEARASVQGMQRYRVRVTAAPDGELEYECDCPVGDDMMPKNQGGVLARLLRNHCPYAPMMCLRSTRA